MSKITFLAFAALLLSACASTGSSSTNNRDGAHYGSFGLETIPASKMLVVVVPVPTNAQISKPFSGTTEIELTRGRDGKVVTGEITSGSGNATIDAELLEAAKKSVYKFPEGEEPSSFIAKVTFGIDIGPFQWNPNPPSAIYKVCTPVSRC